MKKIFELKLQSQSIIILKEECGSKSSDRTSKKTEFQEEQVHRPEKLKSLVTKSRLCMGFRLLYVITMVTGTYVT